MAKGRNIASVADYDEQAEEELPDSRKLATANVAAKRSSGHLTSGRAEPAGHNADLASDSGYSSRTQATTASADSVASIKAKSSAKVTTTELFLDEALAPGPSKKRLAAENDAGSQRSGSSTSTKTKRKIVQCAQPDCAECVKARAKQAKAVKAAAKARGEKPRVTISTNISPAQSPEKSPAKSSSTARPKPAIIQNLQPRRQESASQNPRPVSMFEMPGSMMAGGLAPAAYADGGAHPGQGYPGYNGALTIVERPNMPRQATASSIMSARGHPVNGNRPVAPVQYNAQHKKKISARRPTQQPNALVQEPREEERRRRLAKAPPKTRPQAPAVDDYEDSEEESDEEEELEEETDEDDEEYDSEDYDEEEEIQAKAAMRQRMVKPQQVEGDPMAEMKRKLAAAQAKQKEINRRLEQNMRGQMLPPMLPASAIPAVQQPGNPLPSMRRALPQITYPERRPSHLDPVDDDLRATLRSLTPGPYGSSVNRRPSLASSGATKTTSYSHPGSAHMIMEPNRNRRNSSGYFGQDAMYAGSQAHPQADLQRLITEAVQAHIQKLNLTPSQETKVGFAMDDKLKQALSYQNRIDKAAPRRDSLGELPTSIPLTQAALRRKAGLPSRSGSSRSKLSSDEDTRISAGHRIGNGSESGAMTVSGDAEMKLRIDTANGFEVEFEGRRVVLQPIGDGTTAELIIGGKRTDPSYISTRGSTVTKSVIDHAPSTTRERRRPQSELERERDERDRRRPPPEQDRDERDRRTVYARDDRDDRDRRTVYREDRDREYREERRPPRREKIRDRERDRRKPEYYSDDDSEDDRRTQRTVRRRADTYETDYSRTGKLRRPISKERSREYSYQPPRYNASGYDQNGFLGGA